MNYNEAKDNFIALAKFGNVIGKQLEDDGKISGGSEWWAVATGAWKHGPVALADISQVFKWYRDVALPEDRTRLVDDFSKEFDLKNDVAEKLIEETLSVANNTGAIAISVSKMTTLLKGNA